MARLWVPLGSTFAAIVNHRVAAAATPSSSPNLRILRSNHENDPKNARDFRIHDEDADDAQGQSPVAQMRELSNGEGAHEYPEFENTRVNNGVQADVGEYPFFAQMWWNNEGQGCGGSLIASRWILTAAHCVEEFVADIRRLRDGFPEWRVGSLCANRPDNCGSPVEVMQSKEGWMHPDYDGENYLWDYALLELEEDVRSDIAPITLDDGSKFQTLQKGDQVTGIGMGLVNNIFTSYATRLQEVNNKFLPRDECRIFFSTGHLFDESIMCTNGNNYGMCSGDSGSPVVLLNSTTPSGYLQVAMTSFGPPFCENHDYPDGSARIGTGLPWIKSVVCPKYGADQRPSFCDPLLCEDEERFYERKRKKSRKCSKLKAKHFGKYCKNEKRSDARSKCRRTCGTC